MIPIYGSKTCERCKLVNKRYKAAERARKKGNHADTSIEKQTGRKRGADRSLEESARPAQRQKTRPEGPIASSPDPFHNDDESDGYFDNEPDEATATIYLDAEDLISDLRKQFNDKPDVILHGAYPIEADPNVTPKERVQMIIREIWQVTGYRFTVKDNKALKTGHRTRLWCSQDEAHKKKAKPSDHPGVKHRDNIGMKRYPCRSQLSVTYRAKKPGSSYIIIHLRHHIKHVLYVDVSMPPEAMQMIHEQVEWFTPSAMATKVRSAYPGLTSAQIYKAWRALSEIFWRRAEEQLESAKVLLTEYSDEVDIFEISSLPDGVEILAWGMKKIARSLKGKVVEVGMDATYNTNAKHLELYSIMGEYDNAGFPLSYCLLSTATAIDQGKRTKSLSAWATCLRDQYGVDAEFTHVDKDMAEIGTLKGVWKKAKISLCWWHLRRAVRTRLGKAKLSTTPYDIKRARSEFDFIDPEFIPSGTRVDRNDYEGGLPGDEVIQSIPNAAEPAFSAVSKPLPLGNATNALRIKLPPPTQPTTQALQQSAKSSGNKENQTGIPCNAANAEQSTQIKRVVLLLSSTAKVALSEQPENADEVNEEDEENPSRRTFCPAIYRDTIVNMMEQHYCAHPLIPGYAAPNPGAIKRWAVQQMYHLCEKNDLREVWAYLWENWYRRGRWELWARSVHETIPVLKTTMILESHWRRIKHDFLRHFRMPRCDLLVWVLVTKLAPSYYIKLDRLLVDTGRFRELCSWRKDFKKEWRKLERREITLPVNDAYRPNAEKWTCTCPSFVTSRFLICKHLIQSVHRVPPIFFLEVKRHRSVPFWCHKTLKPVQDLNDEGIEMVQNVGHDIDDGESVLGNESDTEDDMVEERLSGMTFDEAIKDDIEVITEFLAGLHFQVQFRDQRMLDALEREGAGFLRFARACLLKEKRLRSKRGGGQPSTWEKSTITAMFYRARPAHADMTT